MCSDTVIDQIPKNLDGFIASIHDALNNSTYTKNIFFRNDDVGRENEKLYVLLDIFKKEKVPLDLAIIPASLNNELVDLLSARYQSQKLGLHQHGYKHHNHEITGKKCEFGNNRNKSQQFLDISKGKEKLLETFGSQIDPVFTPPWNRCTSDTTACLIDCGYCVLSRDRNAEPIETHNIGELPVDVDWCKYSDVESLFQSILHNISNFQNIGVMLHHAVMNATSLMILRHLLKQLQMNEKCNLVLMRQIINSDNVFTISTLNSCHDLDFVRSSYIK